jgi:hypothetical protein
MANKKAFMGIKWFFLGFACLISFGTALFFIATANLPIVGEYPVAVASSLEEGTSIQSTLDSIMHQLHKEANESYEKNPHVIFTINSYCTDINDANQDGNFIDDTDYKVRLRNNPSDLRDDESFIDDTGILSNLPSNLGKERRCHVDEDDLMEYYAEYFEQEYESFRYWNWPGLGFDLRETEYTSEMEKDQNTDEYFLTIKTTNGLKIPISMVKKGKEKIIGEFVVAPDFKFRTENLETYPFEDTEICILSRDCGATCNEVMEKYPSGERDYNGYEIIDEGTISVNENTATHLECERYYDCETPLDDFGKTFKCDRGVLCEGACLPFCAVIDTNLVTDDSLGNQNSDITQCVEFSCGTYMDCSYTGTCGCPDPSAGQPPGSLDSACIGNDCRTINCATDSEFEGKIRKITSCQQEECSYYDRGTCDDASSINPTCECKLGEGFACVGECSCKVQRQGTNSCSNSNIDCGFNEVINVNYPQCQKQTEYECGSCLPSCDTVCGCDYGRNGDMFCGPCGKDPCYVVGECTQDGFSCTDEWTCNEAEDPACSSNPEPDCIDQCMGDVLCEADCTGFQ